MTVRKVFSSGSFPRSRDRVLAQVCGETVEHLARASPAQMRRLGSVDSIEVGALLGPRQRGSAIHWDKFDGGDGDGAAHAIGVHLVAVDDSLLRDDVVVGGVIAVGDALIAEAEVFVATNPEVEL